MISNDFFHSLRFRVVAVAILLLFILFSIVFYNTHRLLNAVGEQNINSNISQTRETLNLAIAPYTTTEGLNTISDYFQELISGDEEGIVYIALLDENNNILLSTNSTPFPLPIIKEHSNTKLGQKIIHLAQPILLEGNRIGSLRYGMSWEKLVQSIDRIKSEMLWLLSMGFLLLIGLLILIGRKISKRVVSLLQASQQLGDGNYQVRAKAQGHDELSKLASGFNLMADAVESRIRALQKSTSDYQELSENLEQRVHERTNELKEALEYLEKTQQNLIQAEKLAGLGSLVAAVSHEMNTPIGNALTVATTFAEKTKAFKQEAEQGLRRSTLMKYNQDSLIASELIERNLGHAVELITSFKHVAVDQTSSKRREFDLAVVIKELLSTLLPTFKKTAITLETDLPSGLIMDSYPGPLGQVITNLINNSLVHAFKDRESGQMNLVITEPDKTHVKIIFSDNGNGMSKETVHQIYDPFFTTQLGKGGSGLGMHIVHNIVNGLLGGEIKLESELNKGSKFTIIIPRSAPQVEVGADL